MALLLAMFFTFFFFSLREYLRCFSRKCKTFHSFSVNIYICLRVKQVQRVITFVEKTFWTFGLTVERRGQQCSKVHLKFLQFVLLCRSCKSINGFC